MHASESTEQTRPRVRNPQVVSPSRCTAKSNQVPLHQDAHCQERGEEMETNLAVKNTGKVEPDGEVFAGTKPMAQGEENSRGVAAQDWAN
mmetsp:Transcript_11539/g.37036  ORF Transcript_11539/g.37036 Transcript_11539/m.37036 type:complete len:90 (-) Transcript_11539:845-1114(-)